MRYKLLSIALALSCAFSLSYAQDYSYLPEALTVVKACAASNSDKALTIADITTGVGVRPDMIRCRWKDDSHYAYFYDGREMVASIADGKPVAAPVSKVKPDAVPDAIPRNAANRTACKERVAYTVGNSLYIYDKTADKVITVAEGEDGIVFGQTVSRNEFGIDGGIFWSTNGSKLAFYRKDEKAVTEFPLLDINSRTGNLMNIRYPMNGMTSERISLGVYDCADGSVTYVKADDFGDDRYLTNICWNPDESNVFIQVVDRSQHHMRLNMYDAADGSFVRTILTEDNDAWIEPYEPLRFIDNGTFIYSIDNRDGYKNLYLCDVNGTTVRRLTTCDADVEYVAYQNGYVYYTSAEVSPIENHLFRIKLTPARKGGLAKMRFSAPERLTSESGWHAVSLSPDGEYFIDNYTSFSVAGVADLRKADGTLVRNVFKAENPRDKFASGEVVLGKVPSADGKFDNYCRLFLPTGFDPAKKYPLIVYVYGGPHSQMVRDTWLASVRLLELYWAQQGYVVYVQDNRGTSNRGAEFEKAINRQCGQAEMADQMVGVRALLSCPWVDKDRVGVHGWSYGGFMTISLMTNYPDVFKVGVAGGPVIDWKWYEIMYGERYMDNPETNPEGFAKTSLMNKTSDLKGRLLICQGAIDNTVVWQHSLSFTQKCIEEGVQLDYFPYPRSEHNVAGGWRVHLNEKIAGYFHDFL